MEMFKDETDDEEVGGHGDGIDPQGRQLLTESQPEEEVEQHDVEAVVEEMCSAEADTVFRRGLLVGR